MASGNFLIGADLTLEGFTHYVQPFFEGKGYAIKDKLSVSCVGHRKAILASVIGEGDLEKAIDYMLVETRKTIEVEENRRKQEGSEHKIAWEHQVACFSHWKKREGQESIAVNEGVYETIGVYRDEDTASKLFPSIAQEYLLENVARKADEVAKEIKSLLQKRLADL